MAKKIAAEADDGNKTDEVHKKYDPERPIHRIGQRFKPGSAERRPPSMHLDKKTAPEADGKGFLRSRGFESCRRPRDVQVEAARRNKTIGDIAADLARTIPAWISVQPTAQPPNLNAFSEPNLAFQELEGTLVRSFQTWTDFPVAQWHEWYDWNLHVEPAPGYGHLPGPANEFEDPRGRTPLVKGTAPTIECEWDTGAFGKIERFEAPMFRSDWCWPMAGDFVWVAGRWIYDCGHDNKGQVRTELHPCAAVAAARWEGVRFKNDGHEQIWPQVEGLKLSFPADTPFVPGIRFMFFASRKGGYHNFSTLANPNSTFDKTYRFILDVPRISADARTVVVGATPDFASNTVTALNPRLLVSFDFDSFANNCTGKFERKDPVITVIDPGGGKLPEQVIVEIPIGELNPSTDAYGVIVSLGWHDNADTLARRVVKCTLSFDRVEFMNPKILGAGLPLIMKVGANGRWFRRELPSLGPSVRSVKGLFPDVSFFVPLDHPTPAGADIRVNAHGKLVDRVGEFIKRPAAARTAKLGGRPITYFETVHTTDAIAVDIVEELFALQISTLKEQNKAIGVFDIKESAAALLRSGGAKRITQRALTLEEVDPLAELVFVNDRPGQEAEDYRLTFTIQTEPQKIP